MKTSALTPLALLIPSVAVPAQTDSPGLFIAQFDHILGTSLTVKLMASSWAAARLAEQVLLAEMERLESVLSSYRSDSEFSRWLAAPLNSAVVVSSDLLDVLSQFDHWRAQTNGVLNAAAEHLNQRWQQAAHRQEKPSEADRQQAVIEVKQTHWRLDANQQTATRLTSVPLRLHTFTKSYVLGRTAEVVLATPGVSGLVLNSGGDLVVRGNWSETVAIANPRSPADNALPIARLIVQNAAIATSGDYRRGIQVGNEWGSHIMDPRTGMPASAVISATVLHPDPVTAGALATTFNILTPAESASLATGLPGTEYLLISRQGEFIASKGWPGIALPLPESLLMSTAPKTAYLLSVPTKDKRWNPTQELLITFDLARFEGRSHRPFVAVWVVDEAKKPVRQLALWYNKPRWLHDLREWYALKVETDVATSVASATRSPGQYTLVWDGKDDQGQWVKQGKYTIQIEAAREHGTYQLIQQMMDFNGKVKQQLLNGNVEITTATLDYREKATTR